MRTSEKTTDVPHVSELSREEYAALAAFRYQLRRFLAFSERAASEAGLPAQQHQALLAIAGHTGVEPPAVGTLAEQLLIAPHSAAELVTRMEQGGLVRKTAARADRRRVELGLTEKALALLRALTLAHLEELEVLEPALTRALGRVDRARKAAASGRGDARSG